MGLELNITPEDVDALVRDALMKSAFGKTITESVNKALGGYNSPVEGAVRRHVATVAGQLLTEKFGDKIRESIAAAIEAKVTKEFIDKVVESATEKMIAAAHRDY